MVAAVGSILCDKAVVILVRMRSDYSDQGILPAALVREQEEVHCNPLGIQDHGEDRRRR